MSRKTGFANEVCHEVIEFAGDPVAEGQLVTIDDQDTLVMRGFGARLQLGDKGDPKYTFGGAVPYAVELINAGPSGTLPIIDQKGGFLASSGPDTTNIVDPTMRVLADRMRRGQS